MVGRPVFMLSESSGDWASQLLMGAAQDDVLVAAPDMAPFLSGVSPFIKVYFSKDAPPGSVWRMQGKQAELILKRMQDDESSSSDRES